MRRRSRPALDPNTRRFARLTKHIHRGELAVIYFANARIRPGDSKVLLGQLAQRSSKTIIPKTPADWAIMAMQFEIMRGLAFWGVFAGPPTLAGKSLDDLDRGDRLLREMQSHVREVLKRLVDREAYPLGNPQTGGRYLAIDGRQPGGPIPTEPRTLADSPCARHWIDYLRLDGEVEPVANDLQDIVDLYLRRLVANFQRRPTPWPLVRCPAEGCSNFFFRMRRNQRSCSRRCAVRIVHRRRRTRQASYDYMPPRP